MDRDGRQGWSRRAEAAWDRAFGRRTPPLPEHVRMARLGYLDPGEVVTVRGHRWVVTPARTLEELPDAVSTP